MGGAGCSDPAWMRAQSIQSVASGVAGSQSPVVLVIVVGPPIDERAVAAASQVVHARRQHRGDAAAHFRLGRTAGQAALQCGQRQQSDRQDHDCDQDFQQAEAARSRIDRVEDSAWTFPSIRALVGPRARKRRVDEPCLFRRRCRARCRRRSPPTCRSTSSGPAARARRRWPRRHSSATCSCWDSCRSCCRRFSGCSVVPVSRMNTKPNTTPWIRDRAIQDQDDRRIRACRPGRSSRCRNSAGTRSSRCWPTKPAAPRVPACPTFNSPDIGGLGDDPVGVLVEIGLVRIDHRGAAEVLSGFW